jgi:fatty acid desaturase
VGAPLSQRPPGQGRTSGARAPDQAVQGKSKITSFKRTPRVRRPDLDPTTLVALSNPNPVRVVISTALTWVWILAAFLLYFRIETAWAFAISLVIIGVQQHALSIWVHEASHYHVARNPRVNDLICNIFHAAPILISVESYRSRHLMHHYYLGTPQDSERHPRICIRGRRLFLELAKALTGLYAIRLFFRYNSREHVNRSPLNLVTLGAVHGVLFLFCLLAGHWTAYFTLWLLPLFTVAVTLTSFRAISEHQPWSIDRPVRDEESIEPMTRSIGSSALERVFFAPLNFNYHLEHDLFPEVPYHNLPAVHRELLAMGYFNETNTMHRGSYIGLLLSLAYPGSAPQSDPVNAR